MHSLHSLARFAALAGVLVAVPLLASAQTDKDTTPQTHGVNVRNMDTSVKPGDDFYRFANGNWIQRTEIPPDRGRIGVFSELDDTANKRTQGIIEEVSKSSAAPGSSKRQIADLYNSYMNEDAIEKAGTKSLAPLLEKIAAIKDKTSLSRALGETLRADVDPLNNTNFHTQNLFGVWVAPGFDDYQHYNPYLMQGGIVLPDREYYLADSAHMKEVRAKYRTHVANMMKLAGFDNPEQRADRIIALETAIAKVHLSLSESQRITTANNPWKPADFAKNAPGIDWSQYFAAAGLDKQPVFIVWQPKSVTAESALVASEPIDAWKDWLAFHVVEEYGSGLPKAFADERFEFFGKALSGTSQQRPRWQRAVGLVNNMLGDAVGQIYAERYFPPESKKAAQEMVANIIKAFHKRIDALNWMAPATKKEAHAKLDTLYVGVGYPDTWHTYKGLDIKADDLFGNLWRGDLYEYHRQVNRLGKTVDRHEWSMTPQTVNAVNLPLQNALNFPAAILNPPFFDAKAPAAANYGAIGSVIGHEISHSFDSEGAAFDSKGRVRNWWTKEDLAHFDAATKALADQYSEYAPFADLHVNGEQTLGENIADVAGIAAAYDGYRASLNGKPGPEQDGYNSDQQFFIAYAQNWASKAREASLRAQVATDPHSPGEYRADAVRNIDAWYESFKVAPTEKLYLPEEKRVKIW